MSEHIAKPGGQFGMAAPASGPGRQLQPVHVMISAGEKIDREHWAARIRSWLEHQPCVTNSLTVKINEVGFTIYPSANND